MHLGVIIFWIHVWKCCYELLTLRHLTERKHDARILVIFCILLFLHFINTFLHWMQCQQKRRSQEKKKYIFSSNSVLMFPAVTWSGWQKLWISGGRSWLLFKRTENQSKNKHLYHPAGPRLCSIWWHFANANNLVGWLSAFETKRQLSTLVLDPSALKKKKKSQSEHCLNLEPESHT